MSKIEHRLGLSPVLKRLAWHYVKKGLGSHAIEHLYYDEVVCEELYEWHSPDDRTVPPRGGIKVTFMRLGEKVRWVEFGCSYTGGGGPEILSEI